MKKIFKYTVAIVLALGLASCDKLFDSLEGDLTLMSEEDMISTQAGLERLLSNAYATIPMDAFNTKDQHTTLASYSKANDYDIAVTGFWDYTKMRSINQLIQKLDIALEKNAINQETRDQMDDGRGALRPRLLLFRDGAPLRRRPDRDRAAGRPVRW